MLEEKSSPLLRGNHSNSNKFQLKLLPLEPLSRVPSLTNSVSNGLNRLGSFAEIQSPIKNTKRSQGSMVLPSLEMTLAEQQAKINQQLLKAELETMHITKKSLEDKTKFHNLLSKLQESEKDENYPSVQEGRPDDFNFERKLEKNLLRDIFTQQKTAFELTKEAVEEAIAIKKIRAVKATGNEISPEKNYKEFTKAADKVVQLVSSRAKKIYFEKHPEDRGIWEKIYKQNKANQKAKQQSKKKKEQLPIKLPAILRHRSMSNLEFGSEFLDNSPTKEYNQTKEVAFLTGLADLSRIESEKLDNSSKLDRSEAAVLERKESVGKSVFGSEKKLKKPSAKALTVIVNSQMQISNLLNSSAETKATMRFGGSPSKSQLDAGKDASNPNSFLAGEKMRPKLNERESVQNEENSLGKQNFKSNMLAPILSSRQSGPKEYYRSKISLLCESAQQLNMECNTEVRKLHKSASVADAYYDKKLKEIQHWSDNDPEGIFKRGEDTVFRKNLRRKRLNRLALSKLLD